MTRRRWIADEVSGDRAYLTGSHAQHLVRVLRARVGQQFDIVAADRVRVGLVTAVADDRVEFELREEVAGRSIVPVSLLLAVFKFDRMEWAIEKCTELGVARIIPVLARRTDSHLAAAAAKRVERWRRIAIQASEQSRRAATPEISQPLKLRDALSPEGTRILLAESEERTTLKGALAGGSGDSQITLAIGPEGGWTDDELAAFESSGWIPASLGPTILRAETAAIAATAITVSELDDPNDSK